MERKREYWEEYNRKNPADPVLLIETSIVDLAKGRKHFENILRSKLSAHRIKLLKLSDEELYKRLDMVHRARLTGMFAQYIQKSRKQRLNLKKEYIELIEPTTVYVHSRKWQMLFIGNILKNSVERVVLTMMS